MSSAKSCREWRRDRPRGQDDCKAALESLQPPPTGLRGGGGFAASHGLPRSLAGACQPDLWWRRDGQQGFLCGPKGVGRSEGASW